MNGIAYEDSAECTNEFLGKPDIILHCMIICGLEVDAENQRRIDEANKIISELSKIYNLFISGSI